MPRRARIMLPNVAVHVIQRGNDRRDCFFSSEDREFYLFHLGRMLPRAECRLHAYCLMTNHVHLLVTPAHEQGCALLMKAIGQLYAQYVNRRYGKTGHLWEGRFKSCLVQAEHYVLACYRYIELNPVRAGLARHCAGYAWSSYAADGLGQSAAMVSPHVEYAALGRTPAERQAVYRDLFGATQESVLIEEIRNATSGGYALGNAAFRRNVACALGRTVEKASAGRPPRDKKTWSVPDLL